MVLFCVGAGLAFPLILNKQSLCLTNWLICLTGMVVSGVLMARLLAGCTALPSWIRLIMILLVPLIGCGLGQPVDSLALSSAGVAAIATYGIYGMHASQPVFRKAALMPTQAR
jgi:hypothetical protein